MASLLIIDDNARYLRSLERSLGGEFRILCASSLDEAKALMTTDIDLVLTDLRLSATDDGNRDGIELIRWLRSRYPRSPIVAMSGADDEQLARTSQTAGAAMFVRKPLILSQLRTILATALDRRSGDEQQPSR